MRLLWRMFGGLKKISFWLLPYDLYRRIALTTKYRFLFGKWPNLKAPLKFNERLLKRRVDGQFLDLHVVTGDKVGLRSYVAERLGEEFLTNVHCILDDSKNLNYEGLPDRFALKAAHGSGLNLLVENKEDVSESKLKGIIDTFLQATHGESSFEEHYLRMPRRVIIEELLDYEDGRVPNDYKFFVFSGFPVCVQVDFDRYGVPRRAIYDTSWGLLPVLYGSVDEMKDIAKPPRLREMLRCASILGRDFDFVRVDFFSVGPRIIVGEMTHFPAGGFREYPLDFDEWLGVCWTTAARGEQPPRYPKPGKQKIILQ